MNTRKLSQFPSNYGAKASLLETVLRSRANCIQERIASGKLRRQEGWGAPGQRHCGVLPSSEAGSGPAGNFYPSGRPC